MWSSLTPKKPCHLVLHGPIRHLRPWPVKEAQVPGFKAWLSGPTLWRSEAYADGLHIYIYIYICIYIYIYTLWLFNIAMENGPFIDGLPIENGDFPWLCWITRGYMYIYIYICIILEERICRALGGAGLAGGFPPSYVEQIFLIK